MSAAGLVFAVGLCCTALVSVATVHPNGAIAAAIFAGCALIAIAIKER